MGMPLEGIRVLDLTEFQMGPMAARMIADLGAEVIHIERRVTGDPYRGIQTMGMKSITLPSGRTHYMESTNRNKKSISLDLKKERGREILYRLVTNCDVFMQNLRSSVAERLGIDYGTLSRYNPKLVYGSASGYGERGPDATAPAFELMGEARSGLLNARGEDGMEYVGIGLGISDPLGAILFAYGIIVALLVRERLGIGQKVDASLLGAAIELQNVPITFASFLRREYPTPRRTEQANPLWCHYRCGDGKRIALGHIQSDRHWPNFCKALDMEALEKDPRFENSSKRHENCTELIAILDKVFAIKPSGEWLKIAREKDLLFAPVNTHQDVLNDPQALANEYVVDFDHEVLGRVKLSGIPVHFSKTPGAIRSGAPEFGQHTEQVLMDVGGYTWEDISRFKNEEVI